MKRWKGTQGQIQQHPYLIRVTEMQLSFAPPRGPEHGNNQDNRQPVCDSKFNTTNITAVGRIAEKSDVHRVDRHEQDAGDADPVHP